MSTTTEHNLPCGGCHKGGLGHRDPSCCNRHHGWVFECVCGTAWGQKMFLHLPANGPDQWCCYDATAISVNQPIISNGLCSKKGALSEPKETQFISRVAV